MAVQSYLFSKARRFRLGLKLPRTQADGFLSFLSHKGKTFQNTKSNFFPGVPSLNGPFYTQLSHFTFSVLPGNTLLVLRAPECYFQIIVPQLSVPDLLVSRIRKHNRVYICLYFINCFQLSLFIISSLCCNI